MEELQQLNREYKRYDRKRGSLRELRIRIEKTIANPELNLATPEEVARWQYLRKGHSAYTKRATAKREGRPIRVKDPEWSAQDRAGHHESFNKYQSEFSRNPENITKMKELQARARETLSADELAQLERYEHLHDGYKKHQRMKYERDQRRQQQKNMQKQGSQEQSSCKDSALLDYYRDKHNEYGREFANTLGAKQRAKLLRNGGGTEEERAYYYHLKALSNAYQRLRNRLSRRTGGNVVEIEFDASLANYIPELEEFRTPYSLYLQRFAGKSRAAWRKSLEAGVGEQAAVKLYHELRPQYLKFRSLYTEAYKKAQQCLDSEASKVTVKAKEGRPRWFRPNARKRIKRPSSSTPNETGNAIVIQPSGPANEPAPGSQGFAAPGMPFGIRSGSTSWPSDIVEAGVGLIKGLAAGVAGATAGARPGGTSEATSPFKL